MNNIGKRLTLTKGSDAGDLKGVGPSQQVSQQPSPPESHTILAFDPGDVHTGYAVLKDGKFGAGEFFRWARVEDLMDRTQPTVVVVENFLLYKWKALELAWSPLYACRVLGVIEYLCEKRGIKLVTQTAAEGKSTRLKPIRGITNRHALDALKHALYFASREGYADAYSYLLSQRGKDDHSWPRDRLEPEKKP